MTHIGKILIIASLSLLCIGGLFLLLGKTGLPFGKLPGDINISSKKIDFHFPLVTSLIISAMLTVIINIVLWLIRK
jgi:hypothetical protein